MKSKQTNEKTRESKDCFVFICIIDRNQSIEKSLERIHCFCCSKREPHSHTIVISQTASVTEIFYSSAFHLYKHHLTFDNQNRWIMIYLVFDHLLLFAFAHSHVNSTFAIARLFLRFLFSFRSSKVKQKCVVRNRQQRCVQYTYLCYAVNHWNGLR